MGTNHNPHRRPQYVTEFKHNLELINSPSELNASSRNGRWVRLLPVNPSMIGFLYSLSIDEWVGPRWRFGGSIPPLDQFEQLLNAGVTSQFVIQEKSTEHLLGHVQGYNFDFNNGYGYIGIAMTRESALTGLGIEAGFLFVKYIFETFSLRKLYLEIPAFNMTTISSIANVAKLEGHLADHLYYNGHYWDRLTFALYKDTFIGKSLRDIWHSIRTQQIDSGFVNNKKDLRASAKNTKGE